MGEILKIKCENCEKECLPMPMQVSTLIMMLANPQENSVAKKILKMNIVLTYCPIQENTVAVTYP